MRIFLTGGSGFLGRNLGRLLLEEGHEVWGLARSDTAAGKVEAWGGSVVEGDLTGRGSWQEKVPGFDAVMHCAAKVGDWGRRADFLLANVEGTRYVAEAALGRVGKFVHVSSIAAFGGPGEWDESAPPRESWHPYAASKAIAERVLDEFTGKGLNAVHARVANIYGPGDPYLAPRLMEQAERGKFYVVGDGRQPSNLTYVDDVCGALMACLHADTEPGERFIVVDPGAPTVIEAVETALEVFGMDIRVIHIPKAVAYGIALAGEGFGRLLGRRPMITLYGIRGLAGVRIFHNQRTLERLSWSPRVSFREGVTATAASYPER